LGHNNDLGAELYGFTIGINGIDPVVIGGVERNLGLVGAACFCRGADRLILAALRLVQEPIAFRSKFTLILFSLIMPQKNNIKSAALRRQIGIVFC
jgi:ABC-type branched-subunit amino acid transport system permease subunit